jgi:hypothetical protein
MDCSEEDLASLQRAHGRPVLGRHAQHDPVELRLGKSFDLPVPLALARGFLLFFAETDPDFARFFISLRIRHDFPENRASA